METLTARVNDLEERLAKCSSGKSCGDETKRRISWKMVCANKPITRRYIVAKKHSTKRKEAQAKLRKLRRQQVNYFEVPKPLWKRIKHIFPRQKRRKGRGRPPLPNRLMLNAIWYVLWTGCQWKALPHRQFGVSSSAAHERFQLWQEMGIFTEIMKEMVRFYDK